MRNVLCLVLLVPVLALAAGRPQPVTALVPDNAALNTAPASATPDQGRVAVPPKALVGTIDTVGGTTYDWWSNGPIIRMLKNSAGFGVHALWMYSTSTSGTAFPDRNMRYNYYDFATHTWNWVDPDYMQSGVNVFTERSGYGSIDADPTTGIAYVSSHYGATGSINVRLGRDAAPGAGIFEYADGASALGLSQWCAIAMGQTGQANIFPITDAYVLKYSNIAAGGWPNFAAPITGIEPSPGFPTHNIAASKHSGKVALVWEISTDVPEDAYIQTSTDNGATWTSPTMIPTPTAYGGDTLTAFHITSLFPFYDANDRLNIVANLAPQVRDTVWIIPAQIWHYCPDNNPQWNRIHIAGCAPENLGAAVGYNAIYACRPSMGEDNDGNLYVAWEQFDSANVENVTSRLRADIFASGSSDGGVTWATAVKLTEAGTNSLRFPTMVDMAVEGSPTADTLLVIYEVDQMAGFFVQSEGSATNNVVAIQKVPANLVLPDAVGEGRQSKPVKFDAVATPNPFDGRTRISYQLPRAGDVSLVVYDATGRPVQTLASGRQEAGRYSATWDAGKAAAGVYFYTLTSGKTSLTRKLILAH